MSYWKNKSIKSSLEIFANNHQEDFKDFEDIGDKLKRAYDIRSDITHGRSIEEDFDKYYNFLRRFVAKLIKIKIDETKTD